MRLALIVCAYRIEDSYIKNFINMNRDNFINQDLCLKIISDRSLDLDIDFNNEVLVYPFIQNVFNFSKTINYGIRRSLDSEIIVKTDIDIYFSRDLINYILKNINQSNGILGVCGHLKSSFKNSDLEYWNNYKKTPNAKGACLALSSENWNQLQGYNENLYGWGSEDSDMFNRAKKRLNMIISDQYPLYHIKHPRRCSSSFFPIRSGENGRVSKYDKYENENWGNS